MPVRIGQPGAINRARIGTALNPSVAEPSRRAAPAPLRNPPVVEAILDVHVVPGKDATLEGLKSLGETVDREFPTRTTRKSFSGRFQVTESGVEAASDSHVEGYLFRSLDGRRVVQAKMTGFVFNQLQPYPGWDSFIGTAWPLWETYAARFKPAMVERVGIRFLNRIPVRPDEPLEAHLETRPNLPGALGLQLGGFFMALDLADTKRGLQATVTQTLEPPGKLGDAPSLIVDLEVFKQLRTDAGDSEVRRTVDALRDFKNHVFETSLTQATRSRFE